MKVKVVLFASARDLLNQREVELSLSSSATVGELKRELTRQFPELTDLVKRSALSVDHEFAVERDRLSEEAEVALIPPVSGG